MSSSDSSSSQVDEEEIMTLLSNPYSSLEDDDDDEDEQAASSCDEIPDIELPIAPVAGKKSRNDDDKGKEEEGESEESPSSIDDGNDEEEGESEEAPSSIDDGDDGDDKGKEEEGESEEAPSSIDDGDDGDDGEPAPIEAPLFAMPMDQYACYAFVIYCFYFYLCTGEQFDVNNIQESVLKLSKEQAKTIERIAALTGRYHVRATHTASIIGARLIELCKSKNNERAASLVKVVTDAALFQKSKIGDDDDAAAAVCVISGEKAEHCVSIVTKADGDAAKKAGKKSVEWTVKQLPVSPQWLTVLQLLYLLGHLSHLVHAEIARYFAKTKVEGVPMAKGADALAYMEEHLLNAPFFQFKEEDSRLITKKKKTGAYVFAQAKKKSKPVTTLAMEITLRLTVLMAAAPGILTEEQLTIKADPKT